MSRGPWIAPGVVDPEVAQRIRDRILSGCTDAEIAADLELSLRTLQRVRAAMRRAAEAPLEAPAPEQQPAARRMRGHGDRDKWLQVRVSQDELDEAERRAEAAGYPSVSEYVRARILGNPED